MGLGRAELPMQVYEHYGGLVRQKLPRGGAIFLMSCKRQPVYLSFFLILQ